MLFLTLLILSARATATSPHVALPINSQVPPVARVGRAYNFTFAPATFTTGSTSAALQYSLVGAPAWLALDGRSRTLSGTPGAIDVGSPAFTISAASTDGVATMGTTLVVSAATGPQVDEDITAQLAQAGTLSGPRTLSLRPSSAFSITISPSAFNSDDNNLTYYATMDDHTPLPSWVIFDPNSVQFSGTSPATGTSPQTFSMLLIASDVAGFAGVSTSFTIAVSQHDLEFVPQSQIVNTTRGKQISITAARGALMLDGSGITDTDISNASAQAPEWLVFDDKTLALTGTVPLDANSTDISLTVYDAYGDKAQAVLHLNLSSASVGSTALFKSTIGPISALVGKDLNFTIPKSILAEDNLKLSADVGSLTQWLHFDPDSFEFYGTVPIDIPTGNYTIVLNADTPSNNDHDQQSIQIDVSNSTSSSTSSTSLSTYAASTDVSPATSSASSTGTAAIATVANADGSLDGSKKVAIVVPCLVAVALIVITLVLCCIYRRRKKRRNQANSPSKLEISRPILPSDTQAQKDGAELEKGEVVEQREHTPEPPPQIALSFSPTKQNRFRKRNRQSQASSLGHGGEQILANFDRTCSVTTTHTPHDSMKIPTEMARLSRQDSISPTKLAAIRRASQRSSYRSTGLPASRRLAGLGHGRNRSSMYGSPTRRDTNSFSSYSTQSTSLLSSAFPNPPSVARTRSGLYSMGSSMVLGRNKSIRKIPLYEDDEPAPAPDRRSWNEKRQSFIKHRAASNRSPFFGAPDRAVSSRASRSSSAQYHGPVVLPTRESLARIEAEGLAFEDMGAPKAPFHQTTYSASSSLEPPPRNPMRETSGRFFKNTIPEGFPRAVDPPPMREQSKNTLRSSRVFESAPETEDWESISNSSYSQDAEDDIPTAQKVDDVVAEESGEDLSSSSPRADAPVPRFRDRNKDRKQTKEETAHQSVNKRSSFLQSLAIAPKALARAKRMSKGDVVPPALTIRHAPAQQHTRDSSINEHKITQSERQSPTLHVSQRPHTILRRYSSRHSGEGRSSGRPKPRLRPATRSILDRPRGTVVGDEEADSLGLGVGLGLGLGLGGLDYSSSNNSSRVEEGSPTLGKGRSYGGDEEEGEGEAGGVLGDGVGVKQSRTPLSTISNESDVQWGAPRMRWGDVKGKRPVSIEKRDDGTWGSLRGEHGNEAFL